MTTYDLIIRNGTVIDGSGGPRVESDVAVDGDRIAAIGDLSDAQGRDEINAAGMIIAPGFIDVHTHDDHALLSKPDMAYKASQGVSTV
ncbi:MAG: D-aminoacylase, partial [Rhodospirillaceae bacterium]|nr:D-aminoacylase [Rhodospirillaceae bacterium]